MTVRLLHLWLPPVAFMALLFQVSSTSNLVVPFQIPDKVLHLAAYAVLGFLFLRAFHGGIPNALRLRPVLLALFCTASYGGLEEYQQRFVTGRVPDLADFFADLAGALLATALLALWVRYAPGKP